MDVYSWRNQSWYQPDLYEPFSFSTFVCPTEIIAFSEAIERFREIKCEVVGASTDSQFSHLAWINTPRQMGGLGGMKIPLLADKSGKVKCYQETFT